MKTPTVDTYSNRGRRPSTLKTHFSDGATLLGLRNGIIWFVREDSESLREIHLPRGKDPEPEAGPTLPGNSTLFGILQKTVRRFRGMVESEDFSDVEVVDAADEVCERLLRAVTRDPMGVVGLTELMEQVADILTVRHGTHYANRRILIALALLWARTGEIDIARKLLDVVLAVFDSDLVGGIPPQCVMTETALTHLALANVERKDGNRTYSLISLLDAWREAKSLPTMYKTFVGRRCCELLEELGEITDGKDISVALTGPFSPEESKRENWILDVHLWAD